MHDLSALNAQSRKADQASKFVITDKSENEIFKDVEIRTLEKKITEAGSIFIDAIIETKSTLTLFDSDTPACYDGSFKVSAFINNRCVGKTSLVLPICGLNKRERVKGLILGDFKQADLDNRTIEYQPYHLWERDYIKIDKYPFM